MIEALLQKMNRNQALQSLTAHKKIQNEVYLQYQGVNEMENTTWTVN